MSWAVFDDAHIRAIGEIVQSKSDRVIAIVGGALLDDAVTKTLTQRLRDDADIINKLLKPTAPLGNAVPKADLLYLLSAYGKGTHRAISGIAKIRNTFAHNLSADFDSNIQEMREGLNALKLHHGKKRYPHFYLAGYEGPEIGKIGSNRERFIVNLKFCLLHLMGARCSHKLHTNIPLTRKGKADMKTHLEDVERQRLGLTTEEDGPTT